MSGYDVVILVVLAVFAAWGFKRGFLCELGGLLGLFAGWALAALFAVQVGNRLLPGGWSPLFKAAVAGIIISIISYIVFVIIFALLKKILVHGPLKPFDRLGGTVIGAAKGAVLVVLFLVIALISPYADKIEAQAVRGTVLMRAVAVAKPVVKRIQDGAALIVKKVKAV